MASSPGVSADYPKFERGFKSRGHDSGLEALNFRDSCSLTCFHFCPRLILCTLRLETPPRDISQLSILFPDSETQNSP